MHSYNRGFLILFCLLVGISIFLPGLVDGKASENSVDKPTNIVIDNSLTQDENQKTVIIRLSERPENTVRTTAQDNQVASMKKHAAETRSAFERFASGNPHIQIKQEFWITNALVVRVNREQLPLSRLGTVENVERVHKNFEIKAASTAVSTDSTTGVNNIDTTSNNSYTEGLETINVPQTWDRFGAKGQGVDVAVLDTGVDNGHPDIQVDRWKDFNETNPTTEPKDYGEHGTHVSGTIVGGNSSGTHIGVAPKANLWHGAVLTDCSSDSCGGTFSTVTKGIEWATENNADIVSMSLGVDGYHADLIDPIQNARQAGTLPIASSGNSGVDTSSTPGNVYESVGVGATSSVGDDIAPYSAGEEIDTTEDWGNNVPSSWPELYTVPDIAAPGSNINSSLPGGGYGFKSGTSMAVPHVSGVAALIISNSETSLAPDEIENKIKSTAVDINENNIRQGSGRVNALEAVEIANKSNFDVKIINVSNTVAEEDIVVNYQVKNTDEEADTQSVELAINGSIKNSSEDISLNGGMSTTGTLSYTTTKEDIGTIGVTISSETDAATKAITVNEPAFYAINVTNISDQVVEGDALVVNYNIKNQGDIETTQNITVSVNNMVEQSVSKMLSGGESVSDNFTYQTKPGDSPEVTVEIASEDENETRVVEVVDIGSDNLSGSGTTEKPYLITNAAELQAMEDNLSAHYRLGNDIDASGTEQWNSAKGFDPVGGMDDRFNYSGRFFSGTLDGNNHTITGLTINRPTENFTGLFGNISSKGNVKSLTIKNIAVTGNKRVGGLVGDQHGASVRDIFINGTITSSNDSVTSYTGGIAGVNSNSAVVKDISTNVTVSGTNYLGGVIGSNSGEIKNASATATVRGLYGRSGRVGGLVGSNSGSINTASASGEVSGNQRIGGLVGLNNGTIRNVSTTSAVNGTLQIGGIAGYNIGIIGKATAAGDVSANRSAGGLVAANTGIIKNTSAFGAVIILSGSSESTDDYAGGLVAENAGTIRDSFAVGTVSSADTADTHMTLGGLTAKEYFGTSPPNGTVHASYWNNQTTNQSSSAGNATPLTTSQMTGEAARSNMSALTYGEVWKIQSNDYPTLIDNPEGPTAADDSYRVSKNTKLTVSAPGILGNDTDADDDTLTATVATLPSNGSLTLNANGSFNYTPDVDFTGTDSFIYKASDGTLSDTATVSINITDGGSSDGGDSSDDGGSSDGGDSSDDGGSSDGGDSSDDGGSSDDGSQTGNITPKFSHTPNDPLTNEKITFNASESTASAGIESYKWDFDNDEMVEETGKTVNHSYVSSEKFAVTLIVTDTNGNSSTKTRDITVTEESCFIATAAYGTPYAEEIDILRDYRDGVLRQHDAGDVLVDTYYTLSPPVADTIRATSESRMLVREFFVNPLVQMVSLGYSANGWVLLAGFVGVLSVGVTARKQNVSISSQLPYSLLVKVTSIGVIGIITAAVTLGAAVFIGVTYSSVAGVMLTWPAVVLGMISCATVVVSVISYPLTHISVRLLATNE